MERASEPAPSGLSLREPAVAFALEGGALDFLQLLAWLRRLDEARAVDPAPEDLGDRAGHPLDLARGLARRPPAPLGLPLARLARHLRHAVLVRHRHRREHLRVHVL